MSQELQTSRKDLGQVIVINSDSIGEKRGEPQLFCCCPTMTAGLESAVSGQSVVL